MAVSYSPFSSNSVFGRTRKNSETPTSNNTTTMSQRKDPSVDHTDEIMTMLSRHCCKYHCLSQFTILEVEQLRRHYLYKSEEERNKAIELYINTMTEAKSKVSYHLCGKRVCRNAFLLLIGCSEDKYTNIYKMTKAGIPQSCRKQTRRKSPYSIPKSNALSFLLLMESDVGEPSPTDDTIYLPSYYTNDSLYAEYRQYCVSLSHAPCAISKSSFIRLWHEQCPKMKIRRQRDCVCVTCMTLTSQIRGVDPHDNRKAILQKELSNHQAMAQRLRYDYQRIIAECKNRGDMMICFDFMEGVGLPCFHDKPKDMYFLSKPVLHVMGVVDMTTESYPSLHNYSAMMFHDGYGTSNVNGLISAINISVNRGKSLKLSPVWCSRSTMLEKNPKINISCFSAFYWFDWAWRMRS